MAISTEKEIELKTLADKRLKKCCSCGDVKSWDLFSPDTSGTFSLNGKCKECTQKQNNKQGKKRKGAKRKCYECKKLRVVNFNGDCRKCAVKKTRTFQKKNPEKQKQQRTNWRIKFPEKNKKQHKDNFQRHKTSKQAKSLEWNKNNLDKVHESSRWSALKLSYGLSREEYEMLYLFQQGKCLICEVKMKVLCVDHDHKLQKGDVGFIRGLLCKPCNSGLGLLQDDPRIVKRASEYLNG